MSSDPQFGSRKSTTLIALAAAIAMLAGAASFLLRDQHAPDLALTSIEGKRISLADLKGQVVLVNFWATSCSICVHEMPKMVATYEHYHGQGLELVAVAMQYDAPAYIVDYASSRKLPFPVTFDAKGEAARKFGDVDATPTTFVLDKKGDIIARYVGEPDFAALDRLIETQLKA
jgi:peroxiredoxin